LAGGALSVRCDGGSGPKAFPGRSPSLAKVRFLASCSSLDQNQLRHDFVGFGFAPGERLRYQYRLDGAISSGRDLYVFDQFIEGSRPLGTRAQGADRKA
jgi:hypothetical protein